MSLTPAEQAVHDDGLAVENDLIAALTGPGMLSKNKALALIGLSKSSAHYRAHPRPRVADPVPHTDRSHPARLDQDETAAIVELLTVSEVSIEQTYYEHLDAGIYLGSLSTFHRVARRHQITMNSTGPRRNGRRRGAGKRPMPVLTATQPDQVLCWDISFLPGFFRNHSYALYLVIDLFSRLIMGFTIQHGENKYIARDLIRDILDTTHPRTKTVHSDNGAAMTSTLMTELLSSRHIAQSLIRPGVSNDNAQMESVFRTVKYGPTWPGAFDTIEQATDWFTDFVTAYNNHPHTGLNGYTPNHVHSGTWPQIHQARQHTLDTAHNRHPERFRRPPTAKTPPDHASLNLGHTHNKTHTPPAIIELVTS